MHSKSFVFNAGFFARLKGRLAHAIHIRFNFIQIVCMNLGLRLRMSILIQ